MNALGRVLLMRPDGNSRDEPALVRHGIATLIEPLLQIVPSQDTTGAQRLATELDALRPNDWLLITSPRTYSAWQTLVAGLADQLCAAVARGVRVGCVGPASAGSLPACVKPAVFLQNGLTGDDLLASLLNEVSDSQPRPTAVLPVSALAREVLPDGLRAAGWTVHTAAVYRTTPRRPAADSPTARGAFEAVLARSPSAADALAALHPDLGTRPVFAVGPITAARCRDHGWRVIELTSTAADAVAEELAAWQSQPLLSDHQQEGAR